MVSAAGPEGLGLRQIGRNVGSVFSRTLIALGFGVCLSVLLARTLGPEGQGRFAIAMLIPATLAKFLNLGIGPANVYFIGRREVSAGTALRINIKLWLWLCAAGAVIAAVVFSQRESWLHGVSAAVLWLALLSFPVELLRTLIRSLLQAIEDFGVFNRIAVDSGVVTLALAIVFVVVLRWGVVGAVLATIAGGLAGLRRAIVAIRQIPPADRDNPSGYLKQCLNYGWKAHLSNILAFFNYRADIFLLNFFLAPASVGVYAIAVALAERLWMLSGSVSTVILPKIASLNRDGDQQSYLTSLVARWVLLVSVVGALALALVCKPLIHLLYGARYDGAAEALLWLLPGIVLASVARVFANYIAGRGLPELNMWVSIGVVALNIGINVLLIPRMGIVGASIATTASYGANAVIKLILYAHISKTSWVRAVIVASEDRSLLLKAVRPRVRPQAN